MTAAIALEYFSGNPEQLVTVSPAALKNIYGSTVIGLSAGEEIRAIDLIYATLVGGASDASNALACAISGSVSAFAVKMNEKAKSLGAVSTQYQNATGLDEKGARTTARDTALIAAYAYNVPGFLEISDTHSYKIPKTSVSAERNVYTRNFLLASYSEYIYLYGKAEGMNAGFTDEAGYCVVSSVSEKSYSYICVAMGSQKDAGGTIGGYGDVKKLLEWSLGNFQTKKILDRAQIVTEIPVELSSDRNYVTVVPANDVYAFLPSDEDISSIRKDIVLDSDSLTAPVKRGTKVGTLTLTLNGNTVGSCELITKLDAERSGWLALKAALASAAGSKLFIGAIIALILFCLLFAFVRIFIFMKKAKRRR